MVRKVCRCVKYHDLLIVFQGIYSSSNNSYLYFQGLDIPCDIHSSNDTCPDGYCCVRDEFLYTETYCKPSSDAGGPCSTKPSEFECPCSHGNRCATNIHGHITSLFGKCFPLPQYTTDDFAVTSNPTEMTSDNDKEMSSTPMEPTKNIIVG